MKALSKLISILVISILFVVTSCKEDKPTEQVEEEERHEENESIVQLTSAQSKTAGIVLGIVEQRQISGTIKVNGVLDVPPQQLVSMSAPMGGFLRSTELLQGSRVKKGQKIATIENLDFIQIQQDYLEAKSQYEFAFADYQRQEQLAKENVNSQKTFQQAKNNYQTWQAKYNGLKEKLNVLNIKISSVDQGIITSTINLYSPIDGYVTEVNVNIGKYANPTDILFEIVDTEHLHAELIVFEKDVPKLKIGQKVRFTLANESKERFATVYLIGREISADRTIRIHCHIDQEDKELLPGMYLAAVVETGGAVVPAIPNEAVINYQGKKYMFVLTDESEEIDHVDDGDEKINEKKDHQEEAQSFKMVEIETGNSELGYTEISPPDGIQNETQIVIKGAYSLLSSLKNSEGEGGHTH